MLYTTGLTIQEFLAIPINSIDGVACPEYEKNQRIWIDCLAL